MAAIAATTWSAHGNNRTDLFSRDAMKGVKPLFSAVTWFFAG
jgi:hypothetical protein